jgi:DNA-binding response OmpR family regulator
MDVRVTPSTILLLEQDITVRFPLAEYLRECGYRVFEARSASEALKIIAYRVPDLAVLSAHGSVDLFEVAQNLRDNNPQTEIVMAGSLDVAADRVAALCNSVNPHRDLSHHKQHVLDSIGRLKAQRPREN